MHRMVPTPPNFEPLPSFPLHRDPDYPSNSHGSRLSQESSFFSDAQAQRAFPIRTSRPGQPGPPLQRRATSTVGPSQFADLPEHQLRRKTPNGTIDAGYDGSPAQLAPGPPPLKHMILPASLNNLAPNTVRPPTDYGAHIQAQQESAGHSLSSSYDRMIGAFDSIPASYRQWPFNQDSQGQLAHLPGTQAIPLSAPSPYRPIDIHETPALLRTAYQHYSRSTAFNARAFCPAPPANDDALPSTSALLQANRPRYSTYSHDFSRRIVPEHYIALPVSHFQHHQHHRVSSLHQPSQHNSLRDAYSYSDYDHNIARSSYLNLDTLTLEPGRILATRAAGIDSLVPARFREKALAQAHRTYIDLLAYLHHSRKTQHARPGGNFNAGGRLLMYPKPPKQPALSPGSLPQALSYPTNYAYFKNIASHSSTVTGQVRPTISPQLAAKNSRQPGVEEGDFTPTTSFTSSYFPPVRVSDQGKGSPISNAKTSLEMLSHLCEQSGWKWVDGMLLGGCLHYGLEHYEEALEWFTRITILDSSHVEAVSNMAATLYCLNRQEEAEKCWLQAIKTRPQYLEAVEHLVGLLYKKRSREAVEVISFVQKSLKLPSSHIPFADGGDFDVEASSAGQNRSAERSIGEDQENRRAQPQRKPSNRAGFGSSGYEIPGSENGRILALVHAKGTMLYSLKEVGMASEAFEEAVLISTGRRMQCIQALVTRIQTVLSPDDTASRSEDSLNISRPLLLPPERARHTARLVFSGNGDLPGLCFVPEGSPRRAAIQTTSNSLLSLAKIFQDAMSSGASCPSILRQPCGVGDILALYYLSLSLQESPSTANNVGILLASVQQSSPTGPQTSSTDPPTHHNIPGIQPGSGLALALSYYSYGLGLDPKHVHLHTNLGSLLKDIGQLDHAIKMYEEAVSCDGSFDIALTNLANAVKDRGRISDAIMYYKRAVNSNPDFAEAVCGLSTALNSVCDWKGRGGVLLHGGKYDRWHVDEDGMLLDAQSRGRGSGLMKRVVEIVRRQLGDAAGWGSGVLQDSVISVLISQLRDTTCSTPDGSFDLSINLRRLAGAAWEGSVVIRLVERSTRAAMRRWYRDKYLLGNEDAAGYPRARIPPNLTVPSAPTVLPFHTFTCPLTAKDIRRISQRNALRISCSTLRSPWLSSSVYPPPRPPSPHLNVGYVSSDFNNHPLAHLMQSVFGFHDKSRVKAFCYATTSSDRSIHRLQIEREAPVFRDVSNWTSDKLVEQIVQDGIHILVNLNGYTRGARNEIFAARPAPIQMSFMGFAGTLGAEWCDYILADSTAVPPQTLRPWRRNLDLEDVFSDETEGNDEDWVYSENVIFCRETFFCCDHAQSSDPEERKVSWDGEQRRRWEMRKELFPNLQDDAIILGNFNQLYKIDPTTFRAWLRILSSVPRAILWLLRFPELGETNLRRTAKLWAGAEVASRIYFTDVAPKHQHISRARVCDLFLDTPECNAHTTAADVLWSSTPLLTLARYPYKMCSRMAASILKGALPNDSEGFQAAQELIASCEDEYENFAINLANGLHYSAGKRGYGEGFGRLAELRKLLYSNKWTCALFDTRRWVVDLERGYEEAWHRWVDGDCGDIYL